MQQLRLKINKNIIISNKDVFWKKLIQMKKDGKQFLQVISDFDYTLSTFYKEGTQRNPSCHGILEQCQLFSEDYHKATRALQQEYYPIEIDPTIDPTVKAEKMQEWWSKAHELLIGLGLKRSDIVNAVAQSDIRIRDDSVELINYCRENQIPFLLFSAGLGDVLAEVMRQKCHVPVGREYSVEIVSNKMVFDENDKLVGFEGETINSTNKNMYRRSYANRQRSRDNIILIGDNIGDIHMSDGVMYQNQISVGLLNDKVEERMETYKQTFDLVICNDSDLGFVLELVKYIVEEDNFPSLKEEEDQAEEDYIVVPPSLG
ncbi:uncharacterized protein [Blastocystis hominis]|uniref:5'-nucleotidase n=1 Tax=Blastocystis hominis TaxID=12968 RepID=D8M5R1_BLAHO|nr:uncharacterized protein [Blastocystis hominis]CBK23400.2 unnamed protein product [Blastocystis hominis]|eukprot:XP_012897448.1 uncharacterized protein [Blastocystis hominis]